MPCRGCFGPVEGVRDSGAKFISALASMLDAEDDSDMKELIDKIDDLPGYLYRFSLPSSTLVRKRI
jgi:F420-non-reducing hydrogenase small subunit